MDRLKVGVIGCGTIAQIMHLPYLRRLRELYDLQAICDVSPRVLQGVGDHYRIERRYANYQDLLVDGVDAVLILTPGSHAPVALAALRAGAHVLVEKPMCFTLREADALIDAAESHRRTLMVGYMKRYDPGYRHALQALPGLGELSYIQINTLHPAETPFQEIHHLIRGGDIPQAVLDQAAAEHTKLAQEALGGVSPTVQSIYTEVMLGSLIHDINALRGLVGEPESVEFTRVWPGQTILPIVTTVLRHSARLRTVYTWAYLPEYADYFEEIALMGAQGRLRLQFPSPYLRHFPTPVIVESMQGGAATKQTVTTSYAEAFEQELIHFHACVTGGGPPLTDGRDARRDIEILQRVVAAWGPDGLGGEAGGAGQ